MERSTPATGRERRKQPLRNAVKIALELYLEQLDGQKPDDLYRMVIEEVERPLLETMMEYCSGNQTRIAHYLGINRGTLRKKLKQYGME
ncbi:MAG: DNA-binding transcriptional regulator Fis [Gammaproteobacteria bacterium]